MAIKPTNKAAAASKAAPAKTVAKTAAKPAAAAKPVKVEAAPKPAKEPKVKEPKAPRETPHTLARTLVLNNDKARLTNDEIFDKVMAAFPDAQFKKSYVNIKRWDANYGELGEGFKDGSVPAKYLEIVMHEGKRVFRKDVPKPVKAAKPRKEKVDPATDKLNTVAGLGIAPSARKPAASKAK